MSNATHSTTWYVRLQDMVTAPMKRMAEVTGMFQKKLNDTANSAQKLGRTGTKDFNQNIRQLNEQLVWLKKRQEEAFSIKHIQAYQRAIEKTEAKIKRINQSFKPDLTGVGKWTDQLKNSVNEIPGLSGIASAFANPLVIAGTLLATGLQKSVSIAMDWQHNMAKVNATAQLSSNELAILDSRLQEIGSASGGNFERVPQTYEKILSVTGKVNQSMELTNLAVKGAKAGFTDLDVVGNALARTMNVLEDKTMSASNVLDYLMMAKNVGAGEFQDFSRYLPGLVAQAQPVGYNYKDAVTMFSVLSKSFEASQADTYAQNLFSAFKKTDIIYRLEKAGVQVFKNGFRRPISDVLMDMAKLKTAMNPEQFTNFLDAIKLKDVQAGTALGAILSNTKNLEDVVKGLNNSLGETNRQLAATKNTARNWDDVLDNIKSIGKSIGDFLLPGIDMFVRRIKDFLDAMRDVFNGNLFKKNYIGYSANDATQNMRLLDAKDDALKLVRKTYNLPDNFKDINKLSPKQQEFARRAFDSYMELKNPNRVVKEEKQIGSFKGKEMFDTNTGVKMANKQIKDNKLAAADSGDSDSEKRKRNGGINQITMNLNISNNIKADNDWQRVVKREIVNTIVDSARDAGLILTH